MELIDPPAVEPGCGDCVCRVSSCFSIIAPGTEVVPSEVCMLRVPLGRADGGGFFFDLNKKDIVKLGRA